MDAMHPLQTVKVTCYEVTEDAPLWTIPFRQIMLSTTDLGTKVTETIIVMNPSKKTWMGKKDQQGKPVTLEIPLPLDVKQIHLDSEFHDWCCTSVARNTLVNHLPLKPHITELHFSYILTFENSATNLNFIAPADTEQLVVMLQDEMQTNKFFGLELGGSKHIADTQVRYYTATNVLKGNSVGFSLTYETNTSPRQVSEDPSMQGMSTIVAGICVVLFLVAAGIVVYRAKTTSRNSSSTK